MNQRRDFRAFLDALIAEYGAEVDLRPEDVRLFGAFGDPPQRDGGFVAGEIVCPERHDRSGREGYEIRLYRDVLLGEDVGRLYNTIAHEFRHVMQDRTRPGLVRCGHLFDPFLHDRLERDADAWAADVAPLCPGFGSG